jgi:cell division control protein 6
MNESESFFGNPDPIFADKELLRVSHLPESDRIIGRDTELRKLANAIKDAQRGDTPNNVLVYGKTGTGKSLCSKYITRDLTEAAADNGVKIGVAYVDCFQESTETQTVRTIAQALNSPEETEITVPHTQSITSTAA